MVHKSGDGATTGARGSSTRTGGERDLEPPRDRGAPSEEAGIRLRLDRRASVAGGDRGDGPASRSRPRPFAPVLKAACGTGGTFKDGVLELQGDHRSRVEEELRARGLASKRAGG